MRTPLTLVAILLAVLLVIGLTALSIGGGSSEPLDIGGTTSTLAEHEIERETRRVPSELELLSRTEGAGRESAPASHSEPVLIEVRSASTGELLSFTIRSSPTSAVHFGAGELARLTAGGTRGAVVESPGHRAASLEPLPPVVDGVVAVELVPTNSGGVRLLSEGGVPLVGREVYVLVPESAGEFRGEPMLALPPSPSAQEWAHAGATDAQGGVRGVDRSGPRLLTWREGTAFVWPYLLPASADPAPATIRSDGIGNELRFRFVGASSRCDHAAAALAARARSTEGAGPWFGLSAFESAPEYLVENARVQVFGVGELSRVQVGERIVSGQWLEDDHATRPGAIDLQILSREHLSFVVSGEATDAIDPAAARWAPNRDSERLGWDPAGHKLLVQGRTLCAPTHLVRQEVVDRGRSLELRLAGFLPVVFGANEVRAALELAQPILIPVLEPVPTRRVRLLAGSRPFQGIVHAGGVTGRNSPREEVPLEGSGPFDLATTDEFVTFSAFQAGSWVEVARLDVAAAPAPPIVFDVELAIESGVVQVVGGSSNAALWSRETGAVHRPTQQVAGAEIFDPVPAGDYLAGLEPAIMEYRGGRDARLERRLIPVSVSAGETESVLIEGWQAKVEIEFALPPLLRDSAWSGRLSACPLSANSFYFPSFETVPLVSSTARWASSQGPIEHVAVFAMPPGASTPMLLAVVAVDEGRASLLGEIQAPRRPDGLGDGPYTVRGTIEGSRTPWGGTSIYRVQTVVSELGLEKLPLSIHAEGLTITGPDGITLELEASAP